MDLSEIKSIIESKEIPGISIGIIEPNDKESTYSSVFEENVNSNQFIDEKTLFQISSISKSISSWIICKCIYDHGLNLDSKINSILKTWKIKPKRNSKKLQPFSDEVTVRHLLSHHGGINLAGYRGYHPKNHTPTIYDSLNGKAKIFQPAVRLSHKPNSKVSYSGGGYTILQLLVEELTNQPFAKYARNNFLAKIGMNETKFIGESMENQVIAQPHNKRRHTIPHFTYSELTAAGIISNCSDMMKFLKFEMEIYSNCLVNGDKENILNLPTEMIHFLLKKQNFSGKENGNEYFMAGGHEILINSKNKIIFHEGLNRGWSSVYAYSPLKKFGLIVLMNIRLPKVIDEIFFNWIKKIH